MPRVHPAPLDTELGGEMFPENLDSTGLSWSFGELNTVVGCRGGKFTFYMTVQSGLAIYYIIGYLMNLGTTMEYYSWPPTLGDEGDWTTDVFLVRSVETSFVCEEQTFYLRCEGPKYESSNEYFDESVAINNCIPTSPTGFNLVLTCVYILFVLGVVIFACTRFESGKYNQLLGLVQFKHDGNTNELKPVKFGVAFTLFCNFAKGIPSIFQTDLCGRWARGFPEDPTTIMDTSKDFADPATVMDATKEVANLVMAVAFIIVFLVGFCYGIRNSLCCRRGENDCQCSDIFALRVILLVTVACSVISRITGFNFEINFDFNYPQWATLSLISLIDVAVSAGADLYLIWCA
jgi:hypothetical protein